MSRTSQPARAGVARSLALLFASVLVGFALAMVIVIPVLQPPGEDVQLLFVFMVGTGSATAILTYLLNYSGVFRWFHSLRWTLLAIIVLTVTLFVVNVVIVAQLMYISTHDLILTVALLVFAGLVSVSAVFLISRTLTERIHALSLAAQRLASGDLRARLDERGKDEIARLAGAFNSMADSLQTLDDQKRRLEQTRRNLVAWVSHDLRTPLASMRVMNEAILDGVATDPHTVRRYHEDIQREIQHLGRLIDDLFELSQLETGHLTLRMESTSLHDLVSDTLGSLQAQAEQNQVRLRGQFDDRVDAIRIAADKIQRVLFNLLDNAIRHTPPGGDIALAVQRDADKVRISVHNSGSTITTQDMPHIFDSFYQGEPSRSGSHQRRGTGLGLAIARGFVEAHGGKIWADSRPGQGTTVTFTLPLA